MDEAPEPYRAIAGIAPHTLSGASRLPVSALLRSGAQRRGAWRRGTRSVRRGPEPALGLLKFCGRERKGTHARRAFALPCLIIEG
jgi:hypothetical protein